MEEEADEEQDVEQPSAESASSRQQVGTKRSKPSPPSEQKPEAPVARPSSKRQRKADK